MGMSSMLTVLASIVRSKVFALLIGRAGIGTWSLLSSVLEVSVTLSSFGMGAVTVRELAPRVRDGDRQGLADLRSAIAFTIGTLSALLIVVLYCGREWIAARVLHAPELAWMIPWLGVGLVFRNGLSILRAWLNGYREITKIALTEGISAIWMALIGVVSVAVLGMNGVVPALVLAPAAGFLAGLYFVKRRQGAVRLPWALSNLGPMFRRILPLGGAVMISSFVEMLGRLGTLSVISADLGESGVGLIHSGWSIASMYMGFVLSAMAVDYLPRLSAASNDDERVAMINETLLASWVLILPLTLLIYTAAPWVLRLLYSSDFVGASESLRWQLVGDLFKVPVWLFAYLLVAQGKSLAYLVKQLITQFCIVGGTVVLLPRLGPVGFGVAFAAGQFATAVYLFWEARRLTGFVAERRTLRVFVMGVAAFSAMVFSAIALPDGIAFIPMAIVTVLTSAVCARVLWVELGGDVRRIPLIGRLIATISRRR